jgi:hypothetical protein
MKLPIDYTKAHWSFRKKAREAYVVNQGGKCFHCRNPLDGQPSEAILAKRINLCLFPENFFKFPIHLHHCHNTGMTIGAVHSNCNAVLWQYHGE